MKLFLLTQPKTSGYDTYRSAVVCAASPELARQIHPSGNNTPWNLETWCSPEKVTVIYLGEAAPDLTPGVICASFNAG